MIKEKIVVPRGIRYISDWEKLDGGYSLSNYHYPHILDKQITGCGFTEYCIRNNMNIVLCSPRKILLENKEAQHFLENNVIYFRNTVESSLSFDKDLMATKQPSSDKLKSEVDEADVLEQLSALRRYLRDKVMNVVESHQPCKILVTYDSFRHVKDVLLETGLLDRFFIVVDEFQSIFTDARFKSDTEIELLNNLSGINNLCYVSATPMMEKYLDMLDEFKDLPYYEFDWASEDPGRILHPEVSVKVCKSIPFEANRVVSSYLKGDFEKYAQLQPDGTVVSVESREAVLYVNSVSNICSIIKRNKLTPENTNVLCSNTPINREKVRQAFKASCGVKDAGIGTVPKKGEPHKMFTLCTRTVYLGADFYSTNARSFIFSDANIDSLSVDITLDLPQILGRQRLDCNPWKSHIELYCKPISEDNVVNEDLFNSIIESKKESTNRLLKVYNDTEDAKSRHDLAEKFEVSTKYENYKKDYISVNRHAGSDLIPTFNNLVLIADIRSFEIQQMNYRDRAAVLNSLEMNHIGIRADEIEQKLKEFEELTRFTDKMLLICNTGFDQYSQSVFLKQLPMQFECYYNVVGPERIRTLCYRNDSIKKEYESILNQRSDKVTELVIGHFEVGNRYSFSETKKLLGDIYQEGGINRSPKATDITDFLEVKVCDMTNKVTGKREKGYRILSIKQ